MSVLSWKPREKCVTKGSGHLSHVFEKSGKMRTFKGQKNSAIWRYLLFQTKRVVLDCKFAPASVK